MILKLPTNPITKLVIVNILLFFSFTSFSQGTIEVTGNSNLISNNSNTPTISNNTDFGNVEIGNNNSNIFVLDNIKSGGNPRLKLNNISISISGSSDFSQVNTNLGDLKGNDNPINHSIIFTPSSIGIKTATVTLTFSNGTNSPYTFTIQGTGTAPQPEINIRGLGNTISDGDSTPNTIDNTQFSTVATNTTTNHSFTIENTGNAITNLIINNAGSGISISGGSGYFTINSEPIQNTIINGGSSIPFSIDYSPLTDGTHTATVSIDNNDSNENPYSFTIQGSSVTPAPEINVQGNNSSISNGDLYPSTFNNTNFGSVDIGNTSTKLYTINNTGISPLNISSISLSNTTDFQFVGTPFDTTVSSGSNTQFSIQYTGTAGKHSATVTIISNDADEGTYSFVIRGSSKATGDSSLWSVTNITSNSELNNPYEITYGPDNLLWISERVGKKIVTVDPVSGGSKTTILDLSSVVYQTAGQDGLMGFAIHPDLYTDINTPNNLVYVAYTYDTGGGLRNLRIASYRYIAVTGIIDSSTATTIIDGIDASNDHNSGRMKIGPDLKIYYTIGDQGANQFGNACNPIQAQDLPTSPSDYDPYKGKVLRINLDGSIPSDNPTLSGVKSHVYTYGHRNTQGIIFGSNGKLYASEHGAKVDDELNILTAGKNYGWPHIAGYYDNLAYGYCNWSSTPGGCSTNGFSDHNCPSGVTSVTEFDAINTSILTNFEPPIGTYDSTTNYNPSGDWLTWPTVAPSSIDIYEAGLIPNWGESLLITTLKEGTIFRAKLNTNGDALVDITSDNQFEEFHSSNDRYRDIAMDPDGITFYAITDSSGTTSGPSGSSSVTLSNPGVVMKFQYIGAQTSPFTTYYTDADQDGYGDINDITGTEYTSDPGIGFSLTNNDCDDNEPLAYPGNTEILYDGIDNDCDPLTLDTQDNDNDGVNSDTDCDDNQPLAYPGNTEILYDGIDNDCDPLTLDTIDADNDGVNSDTDCDDNQPLAYPGNAEILYDGIDNDCNPLTLDYEDTDGDGVSDAEDQCPGFDDAIDIDADGIPDGCDTLIDSDNDGIADSVDQCPGFDDTTDTDSDSIPDGCDICQGFDDNVDLDSDGIPDGCDTLIDSDNDGVADSEDLCPGFDDTIDVDADNIPDGCDPLIDSDNDGVADSEDQCPGFDDNLDTDGNGIPDGCDTTCENLITPFNDNPLTHFGSGSNTTILDLPGISEDISFTISGLSSVTNGKPSDRYIDLVTVSYIDDNDTIQLYGVFDGSNISNVNIIQTGIVKRIIVSLTDGLDGNTNNNMSINLSDVHYCSTNVTSKNATNKKVLNDDTINIKPIKIYPNPTSQNLFIECNSLNGEKATISLYNLVGQLIRKVDLTGNYNKLQKIDVKELSEGIYMLNIIDSKGSILKINRIVIKH
ncbi:PQQ-dependent sugar dehydrogenase [Thalassobellus sediminis]|uniref:PQQ-dependent sugar dehydrogenase n=1 Tax=Thalassobellus sediminis TaxID=3367753 RepID=UPI0037A9BE07